MNKEQQLEKLHDLYYGKNLTSHMKQNFKYVQLPTWLNQYAYFLNNEIHGNLPAYYPRYKQGTLVMVNFGVKVGSELSGPHFAVVLSNKDDKYRSTMIVVPLSSKSHKGYISLGQELFTSSLKMIIERGESLTSKMDVLNQQFENKKSVFSKREIELQFEDTKVDQYLQKQIVEVMESLGGGFNFKLGTEYDSRIDDTIQKITHFENAEKNISIQKLLSFLSELQTNCRKFTDELQNLTEETKELKQLEIRIKNLNESTFADVANITTISKLRVFRFSKYGLSGNISLSNSSVDRIKNKLQKLI